MEIQVGDFVRTKSGKIGEITDIEYVNMEIDWIECDNCATSCVLGEIAKHSKNIIDLIEIGDYVNGSLVTQIIIERNIINNEIKTRIFVNRDKETTARALEVDNIKSIVTHQSFKQVEYEVSL